MDLLTRTDDGGLTAFYRPENRVAQLVSPPLSDEVKAMLKLSSNPQTLHFPYLVGAIADTRNRTLARRARRSSRSCSRRREFREASSRAASSGWTATPRTPSSRF